MRKLVGLAVAILGLLLPAMAQASQASGNLVPLGNPMPAAQAAAPVPPGFVSFCMRFAGQCITDKSQAATVTLTPSVWNELEQVNDDVNRAITPQDDQAHYGRAEYWTIPTDGRGDCEDYALTKRAKLIAAGVPARALRMAVVKTWRGEGHAVLTVATDHGDYVLDNMVQNVRSWDNTGYQWVERQDPNNVWAWVSLTPGASPPLLMAASGVSQHG
jgi:predicted transglutaminase-like cysteine proteinase